MEVAGAARPWQRPRAPRGLWRRGRWSACRGPARRLASAFLPRFLHQPTPARDQRRPRADLLPEALRASAVLALGVGAGNAGCSAAAWRRSAPFYDFPGRRWLDWALVLPLAMPAYVLVFVLLGQYDADSSLQRALRDLLGVGLPEVRSTGGRSRC